MKYLFITILSLFFLSDSFANSIYDVDYMGPVLQSYSTEESTFIKNLAEEVIQKNIADCKIQPTKKCITAGHFWNDFWIRDIAYSSVMGLWKKYPEELKNTFLEQTSNKEGIPAQDSSSDFGGFPYQTDSLLWVLGSYELAKNTNDKILLDIIYDTALKLEKKYKTQANTGTNLISGAPSFLDTWVFLPKEWHHNKQKLLDNYFLSTNVIWTKFQEIIIKIAEERNFLSDLDLSARKSDFRTSIYNINTSFFNHNKNNYTYFVDSDRSELLGNVLIKLYGYNYYNIKYPTINNVFPVIDSLYTDTDMENNWYNKSDHFIWTDAFASTVFGQDQYYFTKKYHYHLKAYNDIYEVILGGDMLGGKSQLWGAVAIWGFYR